MKPGRVICLVVGLLIGAAAGWYFTDQAWQRDAVAIGAGHWLDYEEHGAVYRDFYWRQPRPR